MTTKLVPVVEFFTLIRQDALNAVGDIPSVGSDRSAAVEAKSCPKWQPAQSVREVHMLITWVLDGWGRATLNAHNH